MRYAHFHADNDVQFPLHWILNVSFHFIFKFHFSNFPVLKFFNFQKPIPFQKETLRAHQNVESKMNKMMMLFCVNPHLMMTTNIESISLNHHKMMHLQNGIALIIKSHNLRRNGSFFNANLFFLNFFSDFA